MPFDGNYCQSGAKLGAGTHVAGMHYDLGGLRLVSKSRKYYLIEHVALHDGACNGGLLAP